MLLLGDDGRGYELARKLESLGVWRTWLGDSSYSNFLHFLSTPSTWDSFLRSDDSKPRAHIQLQLRVRALLFDKASVSLFLRSPPPPPSLALSKLNPNYLQLHGDDVYFTLDCNSSQDGPQTAISSKSKASFGVPARYGEDVEDVSHKVRSEELPENWYNQFAEKYGLNKPLRLSVGGVESNKRTPEDMFSYLKVLENHKKKRVVFKDDHCTSSEHSIQQTSNNGNSGSLQDGSGSIDDDTPFLPEMTFTHNCIPDSALPTPYSVESKHKVELRCIFDTLPQVATKSAVMIERLGIRPEYLNSEQGGNRGKNGSEGSRKNLSPEQASVKCQEVVARILTNVGFESATEFPIEILSQLLSCHMCKLGRTLKVLSDNYRKQCSAVELLKMFLQISEEEKHRERRKGISYLGSLSEFVKDHPRNFVQQSQQHQVQELPNQLQAQQQNTLRLAQQIPRQIHPQFQQMLGSQNPSFQQQQNLEQLLRRRQASTLRPGMDMDKMRPIVQVKLENPPDHPVDNNTINPVNMRHQQMQFRQQQMAAMSNMPSQSGNQFRQVSSLQLPQMQTQNMGMVRAPPVKVEGFQELMGGDSSLKHDSDENKLTSPASK